MQINKNGTFKKYSGLKIGLMKLRNFSKFRNAKDKENDKDQEIINQEKNINISEKK